MGESKQRQNKMVDELQALGTENQARYAAAQQVGLAIPDSTLLALRMETFFDFQLGKQTPTNHTRLKFELEWQRKISELLDKGQDDVRKARLAGGSPPPQTAGGLIIPGRG